MTLKQPSKILVASCTDEGGAYQYRIENDKLVFERKIPMKSPMWLENRGNTIWALLRKPSENDNNSAVCSYDFVSGEQISPLVSTKGVVACHIAIDGEDIYCANYVSGSLIKLPSILVEHKGKGTNPNRQEAPHVHSVFFSPDKKYILSCDLGLDTVFVYDRNLNEVSNAKVPNGEGCRHLVFSKDKKYCYVINEMGASITVFSFRCGKLKFIKNVKLTKSGEGKGSAIRITNDGKRLFVTERASRKIMVLSLDGENLDILSEVDCHGEEPRDLLLVDNEKYAVCANQFSGDVALFKVEENNTLTYLDSQKLDAAISVVEI